MKFKVIILSIIASFLLLYSCFNIQSYPNTPQVKFNKFIFKDTTDLLGNKVLNGKLYFNFVDGNGDIGFDTISYLRKNTIYLKKYKMINGKLQECELLVPLEYFVPRMKNSNNNKTLQGEMIVKDLNEMYPLSNDTIMYKFYIIDRAGNKSNVDSTNYLIIK